MMYEVTFEIVICFWNLLSFYEVAYLLTLNVSHLSSHTSFDEAKVFSSLPNLMELPVFQGKL